MFTKAELLKAIEELEDIPATYQTAEKLATFYTLYDHLYAPRTQEAKPTPAAEVTIYKHGESEFLRSIEGKEAEEAWLIIDELMATIQALQPRLYEATIDRIKSL